MKYTLLQLTQLTLSSIDGDEVNSINDSVESQQIVKLIKRCYGNLAESSDFPEQYTLFGLTASGSAALPTVMYLPTATVKNAQWIRYDCKRLGETDTSFQLMNYVDLEEFFNRMHNLAPSVDSSLTTFNLTIAGQVVQFIVRNDTSPSYYTTTDDSTLVFNSFDNLVDTTLQSSKTLCYGETVLPWTESDSYVIPLDDHQLLLNEVISWAWAEMKQSSNSKAEREAHRQQITKQRKKHSINPTANYYVDMPNYGRR